MEKNKVHESNRVCVCYGYLKETERYCIISVATDGKLIISDIDTLKEIKSTTNKSDGDYLALTFNKQNNVIATGDKNTFVKCYNIEDLSLINILVRQMLPVYSVKFNNDGNFLVAAGMENGIKILNFKNSVSKKLSPSRDIRALAWDPMGTYLLALSTEGTLFIYDVKNVKCVKRLEKISKKMNSSIMDRTHVEWHPPNGEFFAFPGAISGIKVFKRDTWEETEIFNIEPENSSSINTFAFSPNGIYMGIGMDNGNIEIFYMAESKCIKTKDFEFSVTDMKWHPNQNQILCATTKGEICIWNHPVEVKDKMVSPTEDIDILKLLIVDDSEDSKSSYNIEDKEIVTKRLFEDSFSESDEDDVRLIKKPRIMPNLDMEKLDRKLHEIILPGSTKPGTKKSYMFCWNSIGKVLVGDHERIQFIEVKFGKEEMLKYKIGTYGDYNRSKMGCLTKDGVLIANDKLSVGDDVIDPQLVFIPFNSWSGERSISILLPEVENPVCIALGDDFCAVVTTMDLIRIYKLSGILLAILSTFGHVFCMVTCKFKLAIFWQDCKSFEFKITIYNIKERTVLFDGNLPILKQDNSFTWAGYDEEGLLYLQDKNHIIYVLSSDFGGSWIPIWDGKKVLNTNEYFFIVDISSSGITGVKCKKNQYPQYNPPSILTDYELDIVGSESIENLEKLNLINDIYFNEMDKLDVELKDTISGMKYEKNRNLLKLFRGAMKKKEFSKALDYVYLMDHMDFIDGALKLANLEQLTTLAERISKIKLPN